MLFEKHWILFSPVLLSPSPSFPWLALWPSVSCFLPPHTLFILRLVPLNSFHPLDHVAMCLLAPTHPHLVVLSVMDPGGKLPSILPVPRSPHGGLQWPWADPLARWNPFGCSQAFAGWQLDTPHPPRLSGAIQWPGVPGPQKQHPLLHRTRDSQHYFQTGLPGPWQQQSDWNTKGDIWGVTQPDQTTTGQQPLSEHGEWGGFHGPDLTQRTGIGA